MDEIGGMSRAEIERQKKFEAEKRFSSSVKRLTSAVRFICAAASVCSTALVARIVGIDGSSLGLPILAGFAGAAIYTLVNSALTKLFNRVLDDQKNLLQLNNFEE